LGDWRRRRIIPPTVKVKSEETEGFYSPGLYEMDRVEVNPNIGDSIIKEELKPRKRNSEASAGLQSSGRSSRNVSTSGTDSSQQPGIKQSQRQGGYTQLRCYHCHIRGHFRRDCHKRHHGMIPLLRIMDRTNQRRTA
jgi:hypothetical protein